MLPKQYLNATPEAVASIRPCQNNTNDSDMTVDKPKQPFACPFFRADPIQHQECMHLRLLRIADVKQHIKRRHSLIPQYYCPNCFETFRSEKEWEIHGNPLCCQKVPHSAQKHGILPDVQDRLTQRVARSMTPVQQWHDICNIAFGGSLILRSPHLGSIVEEVIGMMRSVWSTKGSIVASAFVRDATTQTGANVNLPKLLDELLNEAKYHLQGGSIRPEHGDYSNSITDLDQHTSQPVDTNPHGHTGDPEIHNRYFHPLILREDLGLCIDGPLDWTSQDILDSNVSHLGGDMNPGSADGGFVIVDPSEDMNFWPDRGIESQMNLFASLQTGYPMQPPVQFDGNEYLTELTNAGQEYYTQNMDVDRLQ